MNESKLFLSFKESIEMGKYEPSYLAQYEEWNSFDKQIQLQYIVQGIKNRRKQLRLQWANLNNQLDFSKKPYLQSALQKIEQAIKDLNDDEERLMVEYAGA